MQSLYSKKHSMVLLTGTSWHSVNWKMVESKVNKLKSRIFLAKLQKANVKKIRRLQSLMLNSKANLLYSIRKITSINRGKKTPGIDKQIYLSPEKRWKLYQRLSSINILEWTPAPVRRIEIPRPGKEPRPLGIPNISDRVIQMVVKNALEAEWEAIFEHGSLGFRPARKTHDAMIRIWRIMNKKSRVYVLDADIKGCFNNIAHSPLLDKLEGFPAQNLIKKWLKAGYFKDDIFQPTEIGTPQGGVISPLLANIALHGMEDALKIKYDKHGHVRTECDFILIRYADDFLVFCKTKKKAQEAMDILTPWLRLRGMEFSTEKTKIVSLYDGIDFLGWNFKLHKTYRTNSNDWARAKGEYTSLVTPSTKSIDSIKLKLKELFRKHIGNSASLLIKIANPIINGWANYHKYCNSNKTFRGLDHFLYEQVVRYIKRKHPNKSWTWLKERYFRSATKAKVKKTGIATTTSSNWTFYNEDAILCYFKQTSLANYTSIKYGSNPLNPADQAYFLDRKATKILQQGFKAKLVDNQNGICVCGGQLIQDDWEEPLHVHHLIPCIQGGSNKMENLVILHEECHYYVHRNKLSKHEVLQLLQAHSGIQP